LAWEEDEMRRVCWWL